MGFMVLKEKIYQRMAGVVSAILLLQVLIMRWNVVIGGQLMSKSARGYTGFQHKLGYTWFEIWHHEGRRARMAAAMFAPDYTHWHGMYEIARNFYHEFLPEVQELADHAGKGEKYRKHIKELLAKSEHLWIKTGGSAETMKLIQEENKMRYNQ
ncbi:MAG: hypothetical protein ABIJ59_08465 [Pseudomonadota bacterium]